MRQATGWRRTMPGGRLPKNGSVDLTEEAARQGLPTAMGFAAKQAIDALRRRNVATGPVLRAAGVSERDLAESSPLHHRISAAGQSRLLDCAAEAIEDTAFGLHLAEKTDPRNAGSSSMLCPPPRTSAKPWRPLTAIPGSPTRLRA